MCHTAGITEPALGRTWLSDTSIESLCLTMMCRILWVSLKETNKNSLGFYFLSICFAALHEIWEKFRQINLILQCDMYRCWKGNKRAEWQLKGLRELVRCGGLIDKNGIKLVILKKKEKRKKRLLYANQFQLLLTVESTDFNDRTIW